MHASLRLTYPLHPVARLCLAPRIHVLSSAASHLALGFRLVFVARLDSRHCIITLIHPRDPHAPALLHPTLRRGYLVPLDDPAPSHAHTVPLAMNLPYARHDNGLAPPVLTFSRLFPGRAHPLRVLWTPNPNFSARNWRSNPTDWQDERPPMPGYLRVLHLGRMLQDDDTLASTWLTVARTLSEQFANLGICLCSTRRTGNTSNHLGCSASDSHASVCASDGCRTARRRAPEARKERNGSQHGRRGQSRRLLWLYHLLRHRFGDR